MVLTKQREVNRRNSLEWGGVGECVPSPSRHSLLFSRSFLTSCHTPLSAHLEESRECSDLRSFEPRFKIDQVVCCGSIFQELNRRRSSCLSSLFSLGQKPQ